MKLNYKRTFFVGLAFFSICAFWQLYDLIVPLILRDTYHIPDGPAGFVMSLDNILALFLLPLFGALSDRAHRRIPFIIGGTALAACLMTLIPVLVNGYDPSVNTGMIPFFIVLGLLLIAMGLYRSPAVALMADITPKPLRSKGNAVINLMGAFGGVYTLAMINIAVIERPDGSSNYLYLFLSVALLMLIAVAILVMTIRERKLVGEMEAINYGVAPDEDQGRQADGTKKLSPGAMRSLILILLTIALWFMGYNAVSTAFTKYATSMWEGGLANASRCLLVATAGAVVSYIPIGALSSRFGRKRIIQLGLAVAVACFAFAAFFARRFSFGLYIMFALIGFAQAAVTVNTFPMVWEISRAGNIGKYTGYYYTCSMAAQVITPTLSGYMLQFFGYDTLFPYAAIMVALAIIPLSYAKHGDNKPARPQSKLEAFRADD